VTLIDQVFVGAGGGFGIVNNPSGPVLHFRAGGYRSWATARTASGARD